MSRSVSTNKLHCFFIASLLWNATLCSQDSSKVLPLPKPIRASQIEWNQQFGDRKTGGIHGRFCIAANDFQYPGGPDMDIVMKRWLNKHPKATVIPLRSTSPLIPNDPDSKLTIVWVVDAGENLNVELVRQGCIYPETQFFDDSDKLNVSRAEYHDFATKVKEAGEYARSNKLGLWKSNSGQDPLDTTSLWDVLDEYGLKYDCYFTVEYREPALSERAFRPDLFQNLRAHFKWPYASGFLAELRRYLGSSFIIRQDPHDKQVIRIIEKSLYDDKSYAFNKKINFKYTGSIAPTDTGVRDPETQVVALSGGLLETVAKKAGGNIIQDSPFNDTAVIFSYGGDRTRVNVDVKNETVRSILTDFLPKSKYERVLWRAIVDTPVKNGEQRVAVAYFGPTKP